MKAKTHCLLSSLVFAAVINTMAQKKPTLRWKGFICLKRSQSITNGSQSGHFPHMSVGVRGLTRMIDFSICSQMQLLLAGKKKKKEIAYVLSTDGLFLS